MAEVFDMNGKKLGDGEDTTEAPPDPSFYRITLKSGSTLETRGFLVVNPLFVGISDENNKIILMFSNSEYQLLEAIDEPQDEAA